MLPYADRQISNLSGGQQQRVFLARALAQESDLYFMDEPFAGVDAATEAAIVTILQEPKIRAKHSSWYIMIYPRPKPTSQPVVA